MKIEEKAYQELLNRLLSLGPNLQLYHWQTTSYARHQAVGELYENISDKIDEFVEVLISKVRRPNINEKNQLVIYNMNAKTIIFYLRNYIQYFVLLEKSIPQLAGWTDLLNIRDDILSEINRTLYRFTLV